MWRAIDEEKYYTAQKYVMKRTEDSTKNEVVESQLKFLIKSNQYR